MKSKRKAFLLAALLMTSGMASAQVLIKGSVYGGGEGSDNDKNSGLVKGNTAVTMDGGVVHRSIYGGGEFGSVGNFTQEYEQNDTVGYNVHYQGEPKACAEGTGVAKVVISGGRIGEDRPKMPTPDSDDDFGYVFCGSRGALSNDSIANLLAIVDSTYLEISGTPLITASVYGGCENGMVLRNTCVKISGGQIGMGYYKDSEGHDHWDQPYSETKWNEIITNLHNGTLTNADIQGTNDPNFNGFHQCDSWPYRSPYSVYDIYADDYQSENSNALQGLNGQTFYGNVFGGGSGYYPVAPGIWRRAAGRVNGNTYVEITGGHILSSVYGGNETSDVMGISTVKMSGGTVGVPRILDSIQKNPVLCYFYGAGKGDQRSLFNTWTNVDSTHVEITGGTIFGSALGGGEDGHVLRNVSFTINEDDSNTTIGTWGYSGYDGNVFGAGRGFSGTALTAGNVGGCVELTIEKGTILGSVYGGGRMASVGPALHSSTALLYGQMQPDDAHGSHGHVNLTIRGGTIIGNDYESKFHHYDTIKGGNVYGGSMGTLTLLDGTLNPMWPRMSRVKSTHITIEGNNTIIKGNVYGGSQFGAIMENTSVNIKDGTIWRNVYGGGYGSDLGDDYLADNVVLNDDGDDTDTVKVAPRRHAGRVYLGAKVEISGGWVKKNVYGGGALSSVGTIKNEIVVQSDSDSLSIGWPVRLTYKPDTGADTVLITGGRIGITGNDYMGPWNASGQPYNPETGAELDATQINDARETNGYVFGGCKGEAGERHDMAELSDCVKTVVTVDYTSTTATPDNFKPADPVSAFYSKYSEWADYGERGCIVGNLYGAAENGHTHDSTYVTLNNGLIGGDLFGGGKGTDMYPDSLLVISYNPDHTPHDTTWQHMSVHSITAGKVFGNTYVTMNGGNVLGNVYGGGELASVGKGNYLGYGEHSTAEDSTNLVLTSGKCFVTINRGTIGTSTFNEHSGHVYGSSKGLTFVNITATPRYYYSRDFFLGYSNFTYVTIGGSTGVGPTIYGSVFGGGEDGHVRFNSEVTVNRGTIGVPFNDDYANITNPEWAYRGNVYGAGRGQDKIAGTDDYCNSAGSVTLNTTVTVNGGTIHRNVYGGGSLASVGPPPTGYNPGTSLCKVNIKGGIIGETVTPTDPDEDPFNYGGDIFGAGRGIIDAHAPLAQFATASYTEVNIDSLRNGNSVVSSAHVIGNVYGGGEIGQVKNDASVNVSYGIAEGSVYGGGKGLETEEKAALVLGNTYVEMRGGTVERSVYGGGQLGSVGTFTVYDTVVYTHGNTNPADNDTVYVPKTCKKGTGLAQVVVSGGSVGLQGSLMPWEDHNPDDDDRGWIFCGSQGLADSILYYRAVALGVCDSTYLEIKNTTSGATIVRPLITASVYGGSENGLVLGNTHVKIAGGQIGSGHYKVGETHHFDPIYDEDKWTAAINAINNGTIETALATGGTLYNYFHECDAWDYTTPYLIYDIEAAETGHPNNISGNLDYQTSSATAGTNGHSFFGNVFGGGSGYYPITTGVWRRTAGQVNGNTYVEITGGHILTAVYGGNETTDVLGKCTVEMSDGTIGIPRTKAQIAARPVNGYLYGAGMGDPRNLMNTYNNVDSTIVQITDGTIFGSVFGGSKEGHVLDSTKVVVDGGLIGTTGFSGYDGHVFGGGKGKDILLVADTLNGRRQFPVGRVGGNTHVTMKNGTVLGNLYGGGQVGLVGVDETGWIDVQEVYDAAHHGLAKVDVVGGTIGNPVNNGRDLLLSDQKAGNVYGGGRGNLNEFREDDLGRVAKSVVNISSSPTIYGSVFGGGQMANVGYWVSYEVGYAEGTSLTQVNIEGTPEIGTDYEFSMQYANNTITPPKWTQYDTISGMRMINHTLTGNVYGGGQGNIKLDNHGYVVGLEHGHCGSAEVNISGNPTILSSVFGGAEEGAVWGDTKVNISGGTIGKTGIKYDSLKYVNNQWVHDHDSTYSFGSVFGGSYGADSYAYTASPNGHVKDSINGLAGRVYGNATVAITGGTIRGNVFGGGDMASVGEWTSDFVPVANTGKTTVSIGGEALIGPLDGTGLNAYVFGGGKGFSKDPDELRKAYANVDSTFVIVSGGKIRGSVFGGGNDAHVLGSASVKVHAGADIGTDGLTTWDGNIFGGGRNFVNSNHSNGRVAGNIDIVMDGGAIQGSIFGGGRMALSGVNVNGDFPTTDWDVTKHGNVNINVSGGEIGNSSDQGIHLLTGSNESVGDIFGSGKGDTKAYLDTLAGRVTNATINIYGTNTRINGAVFGGGEMASLGWWKSTDHLFYENTGRAEITIGRAGNAGQNDNPTIGTYLELNSDYLNDHFQVNGTGPEISHSQWTMTETVNGAKRVFHTCTGNVFGGCQGDVDFDGWVDSDPDTWNNWPYMGRSRTATITINKGTIMGEVYGGSEQGLMDDTTHIIINGGTIGTLATASNGDKYYHGGVYGGGYGSDDANENDHPITVYGESTITKMVSGRVYGDTRVDVYGGIIQGDVYGGASFAYVGGDVDNGKGNVLVNIGKESQATHADQGPTFRSVQAGNSRTGGSVYGANNRAGTPYGNVMVNVISTAHTEDNQYPAFAEGAVVTPSCLDTLPHAVDNFAIFQVYGGSNKADYLPYEGKADTVHVWYCKENTIYDVYGGCNAASIGSTTNRPINSNVFIDGGRIFRVFGGGNGSGGVSADIHGTATTEIEGGVINQVFGGSNSLGQIEEVNLLVEDGGTCNLVIGDGFGGGNNADIYGDVVTNIECGAGSYQNFYGGANFANIYGNVTVNVFGGTFDNLFAGSKGCTAADQIPEYPEGKSADILDNPRTADRKEGNVTLNLFGGNIYDAAYGGSDANGRIEGKIQVNVFNAGGPCGIDLDTLFGAGRATKYEPFYTLEDGETYSYPEVNVIHGTVKGCVFGGGKGVTATTTASPVVNIGYDAVSMGDPNMDETLINTLFDTIQVHYCLGHWDAPSPYASYVNGNVYGGGEEGMVDGTTTVNVYEGTIGTIEYTKSNPEGSYDGINHLTGGNVFGGGKGCVDDFNHGRVKKDANVNIKGGHVLYNVYGGGEIASVGERKPVYEDPEDPTSNIIDYKPKANTGKTTVTVTGGQVGPAPRTDAGYNIPIGLNGIDGYVFGGGKGQVAEQFGSTEYIDFSDVNETEVIVEIPSNADITTNRIWGSVFGGAEDGHVLGNAVVRYLTGTMGTKGTTSYDGNIFGGGRNYSHNTKTAGRVRGNITVTMSDGNILGNIYGGGRSGATGLNYWGEMIADDEDNEYGHITVNVNGGIVGTNVDTVTIGNVYGGGMGLYFENGWPVNDARYFGLSKETSVSISNARIYNSVYGGGQIANVEGNANVTITGSNTIIGSSSGTPNTDDYYQFGSVYGGGRGYRGTNDNWSNAPGTVFGNTFVTMTDGQVMGNVFGGGEVGSVGKEEAGAIVDGTGQATVTISGGEVGPLDGTGMNANVYGGGRGVDNDTRNLYKNHAFVKNTEVTITEDAQIDGSVFGGAAVGHVLQDANVLITGGTVGTSGLLGEGCVFGGGQGDGWIETTGTGDEEETTFHLIKHSGRVGGNTTVGFTEGTVLGCIYGGGKLALTGVDLDGKPSFMLEDEPTVYDSINHGLATINISGTATTVGGNTEYSTVLGITDGYALLDCDYSVGDIFGGGRGDYDNYQDILAGRVANSSVNISGSPRIYCTVFGGGEIAGVGYWDDGDGKHPFVPKTGASKVTIQGSPVIGTEYEFTNEWYWSHPVEWTMFDTINNVRKLFHTCSGNVFGASQGDAAVTESPSWVSLGRSRTSTVNINMDANGHIMSSVFGGAEQGTVIGDTYVNITGGTIGKQGLKSGIFNTNGELIGYGTYSYGNVFGGGFGVDSLQVQTNDSIVIANDPTLIANVIAGRVYGNTHVNITGGTIRGNVFGGGNMASVGMWTEVKNGTTLIDYAPVANTGEATVNVSGSAIIGPMDGTGQNAYVFGGGRGIGKDPDLVKNRNKYCNVNSTNVTVSLTYANADPEAVDPETLWNSATDGRIYGSVYGGGSDCHVLGDTYVTLNSGIIGTYDATGNTITDYGGNIFGSGRNFLKMNYAAGRVAGNTNIEMNGGYVYGAIFGGGRHAVTGTGLDGMTMREDVGTTEIHGKTTVKVKGGTVGYKPLVTTFLDRPIGEVYGGGKGSMQGISLPGHPAASPLLIALVKNTEVEISETTSAVPTRILNTVYGGGEVGNVGHFIWDEGTVTNIALVENTGKTNVTIKGGRIGMDRMVMSYELKPGTFLPATNPVGNVFGGGKGISDDPTNYATNISTSPFGNKNLLDLMATVGYTTVVVENDGETKPWVKGSVYGGSACGHVLHDTDVTIAGGQIGASNDGSTDHDPYDDDDFVDASSVNLDDVANANLLMNPTYHWDYDPNTLRPFDLVAIYNGQNSGALVDTYKPTDGKTWYGNVFGGGSGFLPYIKNEGTDDAPVYKAHWNRESGKVYGNTRVEITGGHILSCVYGGCETADVGLYTYIDEIHGDVHNTSLTGYADNGTAKVIMKGGTVGVPRTTTDIQRHPIPGYVYGSGKGDPRIDFNTWTNVWHTYDTISGGKIYGCIFGSGEDGHVLGDVFVEVSETDATNNPTIIGSTGLSRGDGNIFGAGRGTTPTALTAGSVGGNVNVSVKGGKMLGSIFGGGNLSSVGIYLVDKNLPNSTTINPFYGKFQDGDDHGHITINISGGRVGNDNETPSKDNPSSIGGHVFGGSRGQLAMSSSNWPSLARVKQTNVTITNDTIGEDNNQIINRPVVKASVYGGGQIGIVRDNATVNVKGGEVGTGYGTGTNHFHFGSVYGGGFGTKNLTDITGVVNDSVANGLYKLPVELAGRVYGNTFVNISGGQVHENVYGGGELASIGMVKNSILVNGVATVIMSGGYVGELDMTGLNAYIYGGSKGVGIDLTNNHLGDYKGYCNVNETHVYIREHKVGTTTYSPHVYGSVFGGGSDGHVLGDANVDFEGGTIGTWGTTTWDGNIFGGGRNFKATNKTAGRVGGNIHVNMGGGFMYGNIYGGGRLASTGVDMNGDTIAGTDHGHIFVTVTGGTIGVDHKTTDGHDANDQPITAWVGQYGGNIFGGAMGYDLKPDMAIPTTIPIDENDSNFGAYTDSIRSNLAWVKNTEVNVGGVADTAFVWGNVFGGGRSGRVYKNTKVTIEGASVIGVYRGEPGNQMTQTQLNELFYSGSVYSGGLGSESSVTTNGQHLWPEVGRVFGNDTVYIKNKSGKAPIIRNKIYGGGALANMGTVDANGNYVNVNGKPTGNTYVEMSGGKLGPLDMSGVNAYVFAGGQGQPPYLFKDFGKVNNTHLVVKDEAIVYGSIFGGGEDGHVVGNTLIDMDTDPTTGILGTTGDTTWDGNIFGGGRNFQASHKATGRVGGNITINVKRGKMLGSVFGGGRLGSVGVNDLDGDAFAMQSGDDHGFITVNIGGDDENGQTGHITIGHPITDPNHPDVPVGGNVYGGGKGIAGPPEPASIYPSLAQVKQTTVNIKERENCHTWIEGSVFGSGEDGHVLQDTYVNVYGGQIGGHDYGNLQPCTDVYHGNVYGGGRGIDTYTSGSQQVHSSTAGWVQGNTNVNISGGHIVRNVYGGGNLASVGDPDETSSSGNYLTGLASVTITGGTVGAVNENENYGNVFGSSHGGISGEYVHLAFVKNTHVTIGQTAKIYGSVFGGGEDGHVRMNTLVDIEGGTIGDEDDVNQPLDGNVYGGGRGLVSDEMSTTAGEVYGHTIVNIKNSTVNETTYTPTIWNNVYGGGSQSVVQKYKVVNISDGLIKGNVFGGSREIPTGRTNKAPRWVNMWGGTIEGDLYGCSYYANDDNPSNPYDLKGWASFVNLSGGTIGKVVGEDVSGGNVYGAGYGGKVNGSVAVLIGQNAIVETSNQSGDEFYDINVHRPTTPAIANLDIKGSVFGGSYGSIGSTDWEHSFNVSGYSRVYIDGTGYNTTISAPAQNVSNYMNIGGGVYGCGTNCESGEEGRNILIRNYGTRNHTSNTPDAELTEASRTLTTVQRGDIILFDNTNVKLSGAADISQSDSDRAFAVLQVDKGVYVTNASGIVLGAVGAPAYMDSIHEVKSLHLKPNTGTSYDQMNGGDNANWEWIGVDSIPNQNNTPENARLYYTQTASTTPLEYNQENVIIFNGDSRLYVRYLDKTGGNRKRKYGQLQGFFRMRADYFDPVGTESFAYARPKVTPKNNPIEIAGFDNAVDTLNGGDGGFLSYNTGYNYFTQNGQEVLYYTYHTDGDDGGIRFTKTKQYPYFNIGEYVQSKGSIEMDMEEFREWVLPTITGQIWYVDGRGIGNGGWGKDDYHQLKWGHFPDMPKKTITGELGIYYDRNDNSHEHVYDDFSQANDIIYVVGPIEAINELDTLNRETNHQLKLYRYPGGHKMSNNHNDETVVDSEHPAPIPSNSYNGLVNENESSTMESNKGPGANLGMMIHANKAKFVMENVLVDGLYTYSNGDITVHYIPTSYATQKLKVDKPMVVTTPNTQLTLKGFKTTTNTSGADEIVTNGTILQRGYNGTDAVDTWYYDSDYVPSGNVHHGGALYVDENATVNVEGLVSITGNLQKKGEDGTVPCNVYLPTFEKSLIIMDSLYVETQIGVTSPVRNTNKYYIHNTLSPVAVAAKSATDNIVNDKIALDAWKSCNFLDDQGWFFVNENSPMSKRTTFYGKRGANYETLYFGWTWANVVRKAPEEFDYEKIDSPEDLAWLISQSAGMNGQPTTSFSDKFITQTHDISLGQYVWVPIGDTVQGLPFAGYFDGRGHLIDSLYIDYIGEGDSIYERHNYGMFGYVVNDTIDRTFLVGGKINPEILNADATSIGGLVGCLEGAKAVVSNSEAAVDISYANNSWNAANTAVDRNNIVAGGLVGKMESGEIRSSMAMPDMLVPNDYTGTMGGLVGISESGKINNSFTNAKFNIGEGHSAFKAGGLLGKNGLRIDEENVTAAVLRNCYVTMRDTNEFNRSVDGLAATNLIKNNIGKCYAGEGLTINTANCDTDCGYFAPTMGADSLGYMYADNRVHLLNGTTDTTLFMVLNRWVYANNITKDSTYAHWARPGLQEINGDLPVLLLSEFDGEKAHQGGFRSMGTYAGGHVLQYGGPARDSVGSDLHEVDSALIRPNASNLADYLFIYGDVFEEIDFDGQPTQGKVSIYEHASIKSAGDLANFGNTYVGITFDNSKRSAQSTPGINDGIVGMGGFLLPRDWHMMSTPLSNAPLGFNYQGHNTDTYDESKPDSCNILHYNSPWVSQSYDFSWLNGGKPGDNRYWMDASKDGYFPTHRGALFSDPANLSRPLLSEVENLFIVGSDECPEKGTVEHPENGRYRYPYGMDLYTWYEPEYHWINFKRNGPNHWHSDPPHEHLDYYGSAENVNEEELIPGRGYMASISVPTFLQSHGSLNASNSSIKITRKGANCQGWNLVGNPYHGYLDFDAFAASTAQGGNGGDNGVLSNNQSQVGGTGAVPFYVIYNADSCAVGQHKNGFLYYPVGGSKNGAYAGKYIHPHQGFFVLAKESLTEPKDLKFNSNMIAMRSEVKDDGFFRDWQPAYPLVNLFLSSDHGCQDITVVEFERPEWGGATKLRELRQGNGLFYGYHDEHSYAAIFAKEGATRVPLWFEAKEDDIFTMKWNTANGDFNSLYLIDNILGVQYDMLANDTYMFEGHKQDYKARFYIVFDVTGVEEEFEQNIFAFFDGSQWVVTGEGDLDLVDMQGRTLWHEKLSGGQSRLAFPTLAKSMYLLRLTNSRETKVQKIIVK